jgi:hypothetical protein
MKVPPFSFGFLTNKMSIAFKPTPLRGKEGLHKLRKPKRNAHPPATTTNNGNHQQQHALTLRTEAARYYAMHTAFSSCRSEQ